MIKTDSSTIFVNVSNIEATRNPLSLSHLPVLGGAADLGAVGQNQLVPPAHILEEPVLVAGGLDAPAHDQPAHGEVVQLGDHGQGPSAPDQVVVELSDGDGGLDRDCARRLIYVQDVW